MIIKSIINIVISGVLVMGLATTYLMLGHYSGEYPIWLLILGCILAGSTIVLTFTGLETCIHEYSYK